MERAVKWTDEYTITKDRIVYTEEQHLVPGLRTLGRHQIHDAIPSLVWHYHENAFEFSVATKGCITFSTANAAYKFSGGDIFVSFPNEVHSTDMVPITLGELYWFQLDVSRPESFLYLNHEAAHVLISQLKKLSHHVIQTESRETYPLIKKAFSLTQQGESPYIIAAYIQLFLHLLIAHAQNVQFRLSPDIGRTLNYILDNITEDFDLEHLASIAHLSLSQYKQKFRKQTGYSPRRFINFQKIEHSKTLLLEGRTVTDIAMDLSFGTSSYFSTVFKKYTRQTPSEYVRTHTSRKEG